MQIIQSQMGFVFGLFYIVLYQQSDYIELKLYKYSF